MLVMANPRVRSALHHSEKPVVFAVVLIFKEVPLLWPLSAEYALLTRTAPRCQGRQSWRRLQATALKRSLSMPCRSLYALEATSQHDCGCHFRLTPHEPWGEPATTGQSPAEHS